MRSPQADTDIKSNIYFYILNLHIKIEEGAAASSHDIIRSITMIHCVPPASALRQWRPITFIWHFMAVRSQQLSAMLKGGHRLPRLQKRSRWERARRELEELGERRRRGREGRMGESETTAATTSRGLSSAFHLLPSRISVPFPLSTEAKKASFAAKPPSLWRGIKPGPSLLSSFQNGLSCFHHLQELRNNVCDVPVGSLNPKWFAFKIIEVTHFIAFLANEGKLNLISISLQADIFFLLETHW